MGGGDTEMEPAPFWDSVGHKMDVALIHLEAPGDWTES